jgi:hypothetical protein
VSSLSAGVWALVTEDNIAQVEEILLNLVWTGERLSLLRVTTTPSGLDPERHELGPILIECDGTAVTFLKRGSDGVLNDNGLHVQVDDEFMFDIDGTFSWRTSGGLVLVTALPV